MNRGVMTIPSGSFPPNPRARWDGAGVSLGCPRCGGQAGGRVGEPTFWVLVVSGGPELPPCNSLRRAPHTHHPWLGAPRISRGAAGRPPPPRHQSGFPFLEKALFSLDARSLSLTPPGPLPQCIVVARCCEVNVSPLKGMC